MTKMRVTMPSALVLDLMMPVMDGRTLVRTMRQDELLAKVPFLLVSAGPRLEETCEELAASGCLNKPFEIEALLAAVHDLFR